MPKKTTGFFTAPIRADLIRAAVLAVVAVLIWCAHYDRWTPASWQVPVEYLTDIDKSDVMIVLAWGQAAAGGHISPLWYNNVPELAHRAPGTGTTFRCRRSRSSWSLAGWRMGSGSLRPPTRC